MGQLAQACCPIALNQSCALSCCTCVGSISAMRTLISSRKHVTANLRATYAPVPTSLAERLVAPQGGGRHCAIFVETPQGARIAWPARKELLQRFSVALQQFLSLRSKHRRQWRESSACLFSPASNIIHQMQHRDITPFYVASLLRPELVFAASTGRLLYDHAGRHPDPAKGDCTRRPHQSHIAKAIMPITKST